MAYLVQAAMEALGFAALGQNAKISDKASIYDADKMPIGDHSRIDDFCVVSGRVDIGRNVHITPLCLIAGEIPGITFEDFSTLAYRGAVFAQSDDYSGLAMTNSTLPGQFTMIRRAPVRIGRHAIVRAGAIICPGLDLGVGSAGCDQCRALAALSAGSPESLSFWTQRDVLSSW